MLALTALAVPILLASTLLVPPVAPEQEVTTAPAVVARLEQVGATQSEGDIAAVRQQGGATLLTDPDTGQVVAAVSQRSALGRALNPIGPGCSTTSLCMRSSSHVPYGYSGTGSRSGTWKSISDNRAGDRRSRFEWRGGAMTLSAGEVNYFGRPVTMTRISR
ncbi:hypothetical protein DEJ34_01480 [Curtobacterium sp. MCPF17_050]|uniref:hypothetical protein n=1 Tax=Curtobacterium sp. MCPF17_050 TaxID=2175664 RepID=UPI000D928C70|nr:hypothetical protein [Curtobacterium sp. MCPF17_050]WIB15826.1 hypothetical protein DEJ34_01480 [Curtobacterium sp. MCPF17_050]